MEMLEQVFGDRMSFLTSTSSEKEAKVKKVSSKHTGIKLTKENKYFRSFILFTYLIFVLHFYMCTSHIL